MKVKKLLLIILSLIVFLSACGNSMRLIFEENNDPLADPLDQSQIIQPPIFNYAPGKYSHDLEIEIKSINEGAEIFYSTDMKSRDNDLKKYSSKLKLNGNGNSITIRAKSFLKGEYSEESTATYSIDYGQVSTPQFKVVGKPFNHELGGFYEHDILIQITCTTPGSDIFYTIDNSVPDINSSMYKNPIYINGLTGTLTISAFAIKNDMDNSNIEIATFTVEYLTTEPPIFDPPGGEYTNGQIVNLYSGTEGSTIIFTTDGSDPMSSSTIQTGNSVLVDKTMLIRAYAMKAGMWSSNETSGEYIIVE